MTEFDLYAITSSHPWAFATVFVGSFLGCSLSYVASSVRKIDESRVRRTSYRT
jgi:hypothetical protein